MSKAKARKPSSKSGAKSRISAASITDQQDGKVPASARETNGSIFAAKGEAHANGSGAAEPAAGPGGGGVDLKEKIKELVRLAREQGHLTYNDIHEALPHSVISPEDLDEIYIKLRSLEVEIVDQAEVDRVKAPERDEEDEKTRLDILDDPVRMYLKQMGQVPLLTREQEVEISKRIEAAENEVKRVIYGLGFAGKEHIALAEKLISKPPKERFDRVILDKKIPGRENHVRALRKLIKHARELDIAVDESYSQWQ